MEKNTKENKKKIDLTKIVSNKNSNKVKKSDSVDTFLTHKVWGTLTFAITIFIVFFISQKIIGEPISGLIIDGELIFESLGQKEAWSIWSGLGGLNESFIEWMNNNNASPFLVGLIGEGIFGGTIAIIGFLPLIAGIFFLLTLLEDIGYMSRIAILADPLFQKVGLSGRSVIPMYVGSACSIPGVMAARTVKNKKQRRMTALLTPFIPCGAKLPVIALFMGVFFTDAWYVVPTIYLLAIFVIFIAAFIIMKITNIDFKKKEETFSLIELPDYKVPNFKRATKVMGQRSLDFIIKAGTIIVIANAIIWFALNFSFTGEFLDGESVNQSILHGISKPFGWILSPMGLGGEMAWAFFAIAVAGLVAKENVVAAIAVVFSITNLINPDELEVVGANNEIKAILGITSAAALGFMTFNLFTPPCFAAIGAMKTELDSRKWTAFAIILQLLIGYIVAIVTYQLFSLIMGDGLGDWWFISIIVLVSFIGLITYMSKIAKQGKGLAKL